MQIKSLRLKSYRSWKVDDTPVSQTAKERYKKLQLIWQLREEGCSERLALEAIEASRATFYRWQADYRRQGIVGLEPKSSATKQARQPQWSRQLEQQVLHWRKRFPLWGKKTLTTLFNRERGLNVSESTIGRIIQKLIRLGKIKPVAFYLGKVKTKRRRIFNQHAKRWKKGMKAHQPGHLVQVDHMTVNIGPGMTIKHFEAICPVTKITVAQTYWNASSQTATQFLAFIQRRFPFAIQSLQVDGGSEFRKDFEAACQTHKIALFVLPPRSPELNGCVERCNRTLRYEFYQLYDGMLNLKSIRLALAGYLKVYNTFRPHQALKQATPMAYYQQHFQEAA
jgi:transposase